MEQRAMCFVCRLSFSTTKTNGVFFGNEVSRMRKQECAETISNLLLGSTTHPLAVYFQSAAYCFQCTNTILDVDFSWKQLTALENRINHKLKMLRVLFRKNFEGIPNKVDIEVPDVDPDHLHEWESFTYDQVIQICMKVMGVEEEDSVLHPDQFKTVDVDPHDFLKTHFEEVTENDEYLYLNSFEGEFRENEVVGNLIGSSDRIQIYAKENDTDSSFEVLSSDTESSSYCSSSSGGKRKKKFRRKPNFPTGVPSSPANLNNVGKVSLPPQANQEQANLNGQLQGLIPDPNTIVRVSNTPITSGNAPPGTTFNNNQSQMQRSPTVPTPVQMTAINQVVSGEFLKKFPIPIDRNQPVAQNHVKINAPRPTLPMPTVFVKANPSPPTASVPVKTEEKPSEMKNEPLINIKGGNIVPVIPKINFKPNKESKPVANPANTEKDTIEKTESEKITEGKSQSRSKVSVNRSGDQHLRPSVPMSSCRSRGRPGFHSNAIRRGHPNNSHVNDQHSRYKRSSGGIRPGPSSQRKNMPMRRMMPMKGAKGRVRRGKESKKGGNDSDDSNNSVLSCSSFSTNSSDSDSEEGSMYPTTSLANFKTQPKESGNVSSSSSIVVLSD